MPLPLQQGRFGRGLAKWFGLQGQVPLTLVEDISPFLAIGELDPFIIGEFAYGAQVNVPAVAAQVGRLSIQNPAGSGCIAFIDGYGFPASVAIAHAGIFVGNDPGGGPVAFTQPRDSRLTLAGTAPRGSAMRALSGTNALPGFLAPAAGYARLPAGTGQGSHLFKNIAVITPGTVFCIESDTVNTAAVFWCMWRERAFTPQELQSG